MDVTGSGFIFVEKSRGADFDCGSDVVVTAHIARRSADELLDSPLKPKDGLNGPPARAQKFSGDGAGIFARQAWPFLRAETAHGEQQNRQQ